MHKAESGYTVQASAVPVNQIAKDLFTFPLVLYQSAEHDEH